VENNEKVIKVSKKFTCNQGNYESLALEYSIELPVNGDETIEDIFAFASKKVDEAAISDLTEAAQISNVKDTFILTWLNNRKVLK
jgi:hypothetical protein